jgi:WbqC-like protein family
MIRKRVAIVQSSYIPWKGYFDLIRSVDEFILLDDVQFTRRDWRSRNQIKTRQGLTWLTIPVRSKGLYTQLIQDTCVSDARWADKHWATLHASYARAPFFGLVAETLAPVYERLAAVERLSAINYELMAAICRLLGVTTRLTWSADYDAAAGKNERLIELCGKAGATHYLSGPSARGYINERQFADAGITVEFADYSGYPEYPQLYPPFEHAVSVVDLLFSTGPEATHYMKPL